MVRLEGAKLNKRGCRKSEWLKIKFHFNLILYPYNECDQKMYVCVHQLNSSTKTMYP